MAHPPVVPGGQVGRVVQVDEGAAIGVDAPPGRLLHHQGAQVAQQALQRAAPGRAGQAGPGGGQGRDPPVDRDQRLQAGAAPARHRLGPFGQGDQVGQQLHPQPRVVGGQDQDVLGLEGLEGGGHGGQRPQPGVGDHPGRGGRAGARRGGGDPPGRVALGGDQDHRVGDPGGGGQDQRGELDPADGQGRLVAAHPPAGPAGEHRGCRHLGPLPPSEQPI
jgi:hypothetical protein